MRKKLIPLLLSLVLMLTNIVPVFAVDESTVDQSPAGTELEEAIPDDPEQEDQDERLPKIIDFSACSSELGSFLVTWSCEDCDQVKIEWAKAENAEKWLGEAIVDAGEGSYALTGIKNWIEYCIRLTPIADEKPGESVIKQIDPWTDLRPARIEMVNDTAVCGEASIAIKVILGNGEELEKSCYTTYCSTGKVGANTGTVHFKGPYAGLKNMQFKYTVYPKKPPYMNVTFATQNSIEFYIPRSYSGSYGVIEYSTNSDYSNSKSKKIDFGTVKLKKLKKRTTYYIRVKNVKEGLSSEYQESVICTTGSKPSENGKTAKALVAKMKGKKSFTFDLPYNLTFADAYLFAYNLLDAYPQYDKWNINVQTHNKGSADQIEFKYNQKKAKRAARIEKRIRRIVNGAKKKKGSRAKVIYVNNYLCKICSYDYKAYNAHRKGGAINKKYEDSHTAYGCLVKGKAVCDGYTDAFYSIMKELNIPVKRAYGTDHTWNKVKIGKKWYHVDVTWNDCTHSSKWLLKSKHTRS